MMTLAVLCLGACAVDGEQTDRPDRKDIEPQFYVTGGDEMKAYDDPCAMLPTEGMCAYACDPEELAKHIPAGSCVDIKCELPDGREVFAGTCSAP